MVQKYTLYIDESGDTGIDNVRDGLGKKGASPFLVLGGCLVPDCRRNQSLKLLESVQKIVSKTSLHCTEMNHLAVSKYSRVIGSEAQVLFFGFVSHKSTMKEYKGIIEGKGQDQRYYNKCASYFLERVGHFLKLNGISGSDVSIVFEKRERHDYEKLRNYLKTIKRTPLDQRLAYYLGAIEPDNITCLAKGDDLLLSYADLAAFSIAAAINASSSNYGVPEQRYLREIKGKFFSDEKSKAIGEFGLKIFKRFEIPLDEQTKRFFGKLHVDGVEPTMHIL